METLVKIPLKWILAAIMIVGFMAIGAALWSRHLQDEIDRQVIARQNVEARADSTRKISEQAQKVLGDSIRGVTRLALQIEQERDRLDQAMKIQRTAIAGIKVEIASLRTQISSRAPVAEDPEGVRSASFTVAEPPFRGSVDVALPKPPAAGSLRLGISVDPAPIGLRLGCLKARDGDSGIRRATAILTGPVWLKATIDSVSQSPEICNPGSPPRKPSKLKIIGAAAGGLGLGYAIWH